GPPPPSGSFTRVASSLAKGQLTYRPTARTRRGWDAADAEVRAVVEQDGLARWQPWTSDAGALSAHPLGSCRLGDDPLSSALRGNHELRGHPGLFVTDGSAVPTSLCVNPSLTIAALAERATPGIVASAARAGATVRYGAPAPGGETAGRRAVLPLLRP
ncbi:MAG TPA: GMC family oxidoreductase, partial [Oryzihumus sp.]|nr:GMC family oxidoreductase [Oryzihumus sp.]